MANHLVLPNHCQYAICAQVLSLCAARKTLLEDELANGRILVQLIDPGWVHLAFGEDILQATVVRPLVVFEWFLGSFNILSAGEEHFSLLPERVKLDLV